jgi:hypothetical protein
MLRSNDQFNTTIYGFSDRLRGLSEPRDILLINPEEMGRRGLSDGQVVTLECAVQDGTERVVRGLKVVPYDLPRRCPSCEPRPRSAMSRVRNPRSPARDRCVCRGGGRIEFALQRRSGVVVLLGPRWHAFPAPKRLGPRGTKRPLSGCRSIRTRWSMSAQPSGLCSEGGVGG